ncbi:hypothetical protein D3C87_1914660 [compost metagenome]
MTPVVAECCGYLVDADLLVELQRYPADGLVNLPVDHLRHLLRAGWQHIQIAESEFMEQQACPARSLQTLQTRIGGLLEGLPGPFV